MPANRLLFTTLAATSLLALSACSSEESAKEAASSATADSVTEAGPGISGAVAPGVAFTFDYAFILPAKAISGVQREHAAACERLGSARCRVTGMEYRQPNEDSVEARMAFLLAPDLAHRFAGEGIAAVERAEGKLDNADVTGEDAGGAIKLSQQDSASIAAEVTRLETRLSAKGLGEGERRDLQARLAELRGDLRTEEQGRRTKEAALASTPVSFRYASEGLLSGGNTFGKAAGASWGSLSAMLSFVLLAGGIALPWVLLIAGLVFAIRWLTRRNRPAKMPAATPIAVATPSEPTPAPAA